MSSDKAGSQQKRKRNRRRRPRSAATTAASSVPGGTEDSSSQQPGASPATGGDVGSESVRRSDTSSSLDRSSGGGSSSSSSRTHSGGASAADRADDKRRAAMEVARRKRVAAELSGEQARVYDADTFTRRTDPLPSWQVGSSPIQANHSFYSDVNAQELLVLIHSFLVSDMTVDVLMHETGYRIRGRKFEGVTGVCDFQIEMFIIEDGGEDEQSSESRDSNNVNNNNSDDISKEKDSSSLDDRSSALRLPRRRIRRRGDSAIPGQILVEFQRRSGDGLVFQTFVAQLMGRLEEAGVVNFSEIDYSRYGAASTSSSISGIAESSVGLPSVDDDSARRSNSDPSSSASLPMSVANGMRFESYLSSHPLGLPSMESAMTASSLPSMMGSTDTSGAKKKARKKHGRKGSSPSPPLSPMSVGSDAPSELDGSSAVPSSHPLGLSALTLSAVSSATPETGKKRKRRRRKKKKGGKHDEHDGLVLGDSMPGPLDSFAAAASASSDSSDPDGEDDLISSASVTTPPTSAYGSTLGLEEYSTHYLSDDSLMGVCSSVSSIDSAMNAAVSLDKESIQTALSDVIVSPSSGSSSTSSSAPSTVDARMAGAIYLVNLTDLVHRSNSGLDINMEWLVRLNDCLFECEPKLILKLCQTMMRSLDAHLITCVCRVLFNLLSLSLLLSDAGSSAGSSSSLSKKKKCPMTGKMSGPMRSAAKAMCRKIESRWGASAEVCGSLGPSQKVRVMPSQHVVSQIRKCMDLLNQME